jgi:hypothetical protein
MKQATVPSTDQGGGKRRADGRLKSLITVISRLADRAPAPYSARQMREQVPHSAQRVQAQFPSPAPYSLHLQVATYSARQVQAPRAY